VDDDDVGSDMARSDILISPPISDEENEVYSFARCVTRRTEFQETDMLNPQLSNGQRFPLIKVFREAIRESNLKNGKDIRFKKNYLQGALWCVGIPVVGIGFTAVNARIKSLLKLDQYKTNTLVQGSIGIRL
jgi:hypothetical protein